MKLLLESAAPKTCELILDLPERTPAVKADPEQLRQVAMSLVSNACDALEGRGGTVGVRVRTETLHKASVAGFVAGPCVVLEVTDDGVGMTSDVVARAFDPFFTTKFAGRGLGLAATLGIVRSHRGTVDIASKPGAGSTVSVYLPAFVANERSSTTDLAPPSPRPRNVLVVDDELAVRETARRVLERRGVGVLVAADGREALRTIAQHAVQIGAVVIDLAMPRMGGTELVAELRQQNPALRVLLMSGHPPDAEAAAAQVDVTDAPFLQKPFDARELADAVLRLLEG
jgi:CheY-like chemotaxis protein